MIALEVKNLSKVYRLYQSPVYRLKEIILRKPFHTPFYALSDINLTVLQGETLGIIGKNGAGKSTLLKILAKTLKPTSGSLTVNGKTAALLELGTGFNPELIGEENIYLTGYLMGLSKAEIDEKRQEIINFSELGDFIKRPVKTYSSGMYMRLAFSIATTVNPDILIIDEALAVGDEYFQKKCIDRMMNFKNSGKTILFCSHNTYQIQELCNHTIWIHKGLVKSLGGTGKVIREYQDFERSKSAALKEKVFQTLEAKDIREKPVRIANIKIMDKDCMEIESLRPFEPVVISVKIGCNNSGIKGHIGFVIIRNDEVMCFGTTTHFDGLSPVVFSDGKEVKISLNRLPILSGIYRLLVVVADEFALHPYDIVTIPFTITGNHKEFGMTYIEHEWIF